MQGAEFLFRRLLIGDVLVHIPETFEETVHAVDTVGVPRFGHLQRTEEHLIQTQRVGAELGNHVIGIDHIEHRLTHLFYRPAADILLGTGGVTRQFG